MDQFLHPIIVAFAWIWVTIHKGLVWLGFPDGPGAGWVVSIIIMTLLVRTAIIPLYLKQMKSQRNMQLLQPEMKKIQAKYKGKKDQVSKQRMNEETMALYKKHGSSPFASCLPMLVQLPVLFGLYRVIFAVEQIKDGNYRYDGLGPLDQTVATDINSSTVFGVGLSNSLGTVNTWAERIVFIVFIIVMVGLQFLTMRMSMHKNMNQAAQDPDNPMVRSQKSMMYMMPLMFIFTGFIFQMGLLVYMVTGSFYGWAQQFWVIKTMPTPGSPAAQELMDKRETKYKAWAVPEFEAYDAQLETLGKDEEAIDELNKATLVSVQKSARPQKVASDFPEDWTAAEKVAVYRGLAMEPWKAVPDETWMKSLVLAKMSQNAAEEARKMRPKKLTREQRLRLAAQEREQREAEERRKERQERREQERSRTGGNLTPEEIERRRQQRRQERRRQAKKKQQGGM